MAEYQLYHFDTRFLADALRYIFVYADVPFDDIRLTVDEWRAMKEKSPWEQLPFLKLSDGRALGQSGTIAEFLGKKFDLVGDDDWSVIRCKEISDSLRDVRQEWRKAFFQRNRDKQILAKRSFIDVTTKNYLPQLAEMQKQSDGIYLVCDRLTYADILFAQNIVFFEETLGVSILGGFPKLKELKDAILEDPKIKKYIESTKSKADTCMLNLLHITT